MVTFFCVCERVEFDHPCIKTMYIYDIVSALDDASSIVDGRNTQYRTIHERRLRGGRCRKFELFKSQLNRGAYDSTSKFRFDSIRFQFHTLNLIISN
jgi:hypothetical protein